MNGAESLLRTLIDSGVEVCFTNPGTSEMHFVAALDRFPGMRCVPGLFEGVVTGAADGYARMTGHPGATLLHLGPGFGNGLANLHNARKALTPMVNIVGDHAIRHRACDAPLTADVEGIVRPVSHWVRTSINANSVAVDGAAAVAAARSYPGQIATLILPANTAWDVATTSAAPMQPTAAEPVDTATVRAVAKVLRRRLRSTALFLDGKALIGRSLQLAGGIAAATGARLVTKTFNARHERGIGRVPVPRLPYPVDQAMETLSGIRDLILIGAKPPTAFFAYPDRPSLLAPPDCAVYTLSTPDQDTAHALEWLTDELNAPGVAAPLPTAPAPELPALTAEFSAENVCRVIAVMIPDNSIVIDESITTGRCIDRLTMGSKPHDWLQLSGGAIGIGLPLAIGAAIACPDRKILGLQADGSAMYTIQALWTQARENLDITTVVFANRKYQILLHELHNIKAEPPGRQALELLELNRPSLDFCAIANGMGVEAVRVANVGSLIQALQHGLASPGPYLIEAVI